MRLFQVSKLVALELLKDTHIYCNCKNRIFQESENILIKFFWEKCWSVASKKTADKNSFSSIFKLQIGLMTKICMKKLQRNQFPITLLNLTCCSVQPQFTRNVQKIFCISKFLHSLTGISKWKNTLKLNCYEFYIYIIVWMLKNFRLCKLYNLRNKKDRYNFVFHRFES